MNHNARPFIIQGICALLIVALGVFVGYHFFSDKTVPTRGARADVGILVEVVEVEEKAHNLTLKSTGTVEAHRTMNLKSEVSGRVAYVNEKFYPGAHLKKGDVIAKIAPDDYQIKLTQTRITLSQREAALIQEEAKGRAAQAELKALQKSILDGQTLTPEQESLITRAPQLQEAIANVELAKANVQQAQLDYDRSVIRMPYDGVVQTVQISPGDYLSGATTLGAIAATDEVWIRVSVQPSLIAWTGTTPDDFAALDASVSYEMGGKTVSRPAQILSMLGSVESLGRMVQFIVSVKDPFGAPEESPLLLGTFVHASLQTKRTLNSVELPRSYVREGNQVYVCTPDNRLDIRQITTPYRTDDYVYVTEGLKSGDRVVTTLISSPISGRKLRVKGESHPVGTVSEDTGLMRPPM